jgi:Tfp pilus assembly protein PilE
MMRKSGFSLLEAICTLFVVFLLLGVCCQSFKQYAASLNFSAAKSESLTSIQVALQRMLDDSRQATQFINPSTAGGVGNSTLEMWMVNPQLLNCVSRTPSDNIRVKYYVSNGALLRDSTPFGGATTTWQVADSVQGLGVLGLSSWSSLNDPGVNAVQIQLSLTESTRTLVVSGCSLRPPF